jgi:hypothetical protein
LQTLEIFIPRFAVNVEPGGFDAVKSRCPGAGAAVLQARIGFAPIKCPFHY